MVDERVPGCGDLHHGAGVQLTGGWTARRARPETAHTDRGAEDPMTGPTLAVTNLKVRIGQREIVHGVSFEVNREQTVGIVGESGSGKTMTVLAATGLLDAPGARVSGSSTLAGEPEMQLVGARPKDLRRVHGSRIGFVFQDPGTSLNPLLTLERQITESLETHRRVTRREARARALELLDAVGLPDPET